MANKINIGNINIGSVKLGTADVSLYLGENKVYPLCTPHTPPTVATWVTYTSSDVQPYGTVCYGIKIDTVNIEYPTYDDIQLVFASTSDPSRLIVITYYTNDGEWHTQCFDNQGFVFDRLSHIDDNEILTEVFSDFDICNEYQYVEDEDCNMCEIPTEFQLYIIPPFEGKWLAIYSDSHTESAECDSSSAITQNEILGDNLVSVIIGNCVTSIGNGVFSSCSSLTSCTIGSGVTSIGQFAFDNCSGLTSITIPNSVTSIGVFAFQSCVSLTSVTIGSGVTSIGIYAFNYCTGLTSITVNAITPPTLGAYAFDYTNNCPIYVPAGSISAYQSAWSMYASRIQAIPNS